MNRVCRAVLDYIEALQAGQSRPEFADLDDTERDLLRQELQAIMAIYNNRCRL